MGWLTNIVGRSTSAWRNLRLFLLAILVVYVAASFYPLVRSKQWDPRARSMLDIVRQEFVRQGWNRSVPPVSLSGPGYYSGCRGFLLEHLTADACLGLRTGEDAGLPPDSIKKAIEDACKKSPCPYRGTLVLRIDYMSAPSISHGSDGSTTTKRSHVGTYHFKLQF